MSTARESSQLRGNGIPVSRYGGNYDEFGFTHRAWVPITDATRDPAFEHSRPEVEHARPTAQETPLLSV